MKPLQWRATWAAIGAASGWAGGKLPLFSILAYFWGS